MKRQTTYYGLFCLQSTSISAKEGNIKQLGNKNGKQKQNISHYNGGKQAYLPAIQQFFY